MNIIRLLLIGGLIYFAIQQKKEGTRNIILIVTGLLAICMLSKEGFTVNPGSHSLQRYGSGELEGSLNDFFMDSFSEDNEKRLSQRPDADTGQRGETLPYTIRLKQGYRDTTNDIHSVSELANMFECEINTNRNNWVEAYPKASSPGINQIGSGEDLSILYFITCDPSQALQNTSPPPPPTAPPPPCPTVAPAPPCPTVAPAPPCYAKNLNECNNKHEIIDQLQNKINQTCKDIRGDNWVFDVDDSDCCDCTSWIWDSCSESAQANC